MFQDRIAAELVLTAQTIVVKAELFEEIKKDWPAHNILAVIEDRDRVVQMWRDKGLLCLQPKKGDRKCYPLSRRAN